MKKITILITTFILGFFNVSTYFVQAGFMNNNNTEIRVSGSSSFGQSNYNGYNENYNYSDFVYKSINWGLSLMSLIIIGNFILNPSFANFRKIFYIGTIWLAVSLVYSFYKYDL